MAWVRRDALRPNRSSFNTNVSQICYGCSPTFVSLRSFLALRSKHLGFISLFVWHFDEVIFRQTNIFYVTKTRNAKSKSNSKKWPTATTSIASWTCSHLHRKLESQKIDTSNVYFFLLLNSNWVGGVNLAQITAPLRAEGAKGVDKTVLNYYKVKWVGRFDANLIKQHAETLRKWLCNQKHFTRTKHLQLWLMHFVASSK